MHMTAVQIQAWMAPWSSGLGRLGSICTSRKLIDYQGFFLRPFLTSLLLIPNGQCLPPAHALCSRKEEELLASPRAQLEVTQDLGALCSVEEKTAILVLKDISSMTK